MRKPASIGILLAGIVLGLGGTTAGYGQPAPEGLHGGSAGAPSGLPAPPAAAPAPGDGNGGAGGGQGRFAGEWSGKYVCKQGVTGLHLIIAEKGGANVVALIHFFPVPENPRVPEGCYTAGGSYDPGSGNFSLQHQDWVMRPRNYLMVDVHGTVDPAGQTMTGSLVGAPSCSIFYLSRGAASRPAPDQCLHPH